MRAFLCVAPALLPVWCSGAASSVTIAMGNSSLASLKYGGTEFLWANPSDSAHGDYDGRVFYVSKVILRRADGTETTLDAGGLSQDGAPNVPFDAGFFQKIAQALVKQRIQALLILEQQNTRYYAYPALYDELRGGASTPDAVRRVYLHAFSVLNVADGPLDARRAELVQAVEKGDILFFRAWFDDVYNAKVKSIYQQANLGVK